MTWIQTYSGKKFFLWNPLQDSIVIEDIAHSLSAICRFNGHCNEFYSVSQHSVILSRAAEQYAREDDSVLTDPVTLARQALLHDAAEAYIGDITSPVKAMLPEIARIENQIAVAIAMRFNLQLPFDLTVKNMDTALLFTEMLQLMGEPPDEWEQIRSIQPLAIKIVPEPPEVAKANFLTRYVEIFEERQPEPETPVGVTSYKGINLSGQSMSAECVNCGKPQTAPNEGRVIGEGEIWPEDKLLPDELQRRWTCSFECYTVLVARHSG